MPSVFSHAIAGFTLGHAGVSATDRWKLALATALSAVVPDLDAIGHMLGVPYASFWGHRGFSHSIVFALLWGGIVAWTFFRKVPWLSWVLIALATVSHPLLDMCTNGGLGCALFAPFDNARYFFPWRPIKVAPIGVGAFFTKHGLSVFMSEMQFVWLPSIGLIGCSLLLRRKTNG